ncbi:MAG: hypothetical protein K9L22_08925 [Methylococcaceae bacterium]|nr:hypothetical protein [Methylococcaceae bacterium]
MQDYLPEIQALLSDWYLLTMNNPLYAGALVLIVWLCLVFFYNIKVLFLKKKHKVSEQGRIELQRQLEAVQQQLKQSEEKFADSLQQAEQNAQTAADFVEQVQERNLAIVAAIRALAAKFDLNEQLVGSDNDMKAEFIWQQQDNIVAQLTERLEAVLKANNEREAIHQQEIAQLKEKEVLINSLHATLDTQTKQFAQLEQALETQKLRQQEQQIQAQQQLASTLEKHQLDFTKLLNDLKNQTNEQSQSVQEVSTVENQASDAIVAVAIESPASEPEVITPRVSLDANIETVQPEVVSVEPLVVEAPEVVSPVTTTPSPDSIEDLHISTLESVVSPEPFSVREIVQPDVVNIIKKDASIVDEVKFKEPNYNASSMDLSGTFKGLLGKMTAKKKVNDKPVVEKSEADEKKANKSPSKLKGLYSNLTSKGK